MSNDGKVNSPLTREELYRLAWSEPMLRIAEKFEVSSSYLARVYSRLNVPRPAPGYWAKVEVGKAPPIPKLPEPRPGDELVWSRDGSLPVHHNAIPKAPNATPHKHIISKAPRNQQHQLIIGAKNYFEAGRTSKYMDVPYLKPAKKLLVDVISTKTSLDKILTFANLLFLTLEANGHRVVLAPNSENFTRIDCDEREAEESNSHYRSLWSPYRPTVVYIGTVAIGLTLIEMSEQVSARYINGTYVRESEYVPDKSHRGRTTWTTTRDFPSGRICLHAYAPYRVAKWFKKWKETKSHSLSDQISIIVKGLDAAAVEIAKLVEEGNRNAAIQQAEWIAQRERWKKDEEERRKAKALAESKEDLLQIIAEWAKWKNIERFFSDVELNLPQLSREEQQAFAARLETARTLLDSENTIEILKKWKLPTER